MLLGIPGVLGLGLFQCLRPLDMFISLLFGNLLFGAGDVVLGVLILGILGDIFVLSDVVFGVLLLDDVVFGVLLLDDVVLCASPQTIRNFS